MSNEENLLFVVCVSWLAKMSFGGWNLPPRAWWGIPPERRLSTPWGSWGSVGQLAAKFGLPYERGNFNCLIRKRAQLSLVRIGRAGSWSSRGAFALRATVCVDGYTVPAVLQASGTCQGSFLSSQSWGQQSAESGSCSDSLCGLSCLCAGVRFPVTGGLFGKNLLLLGSQTTPSQWPRSGDLHWASLGAHTALCQAGHPQSSRVITLRRTVRELGLLTGTWASSR